MASPLARLPNSPCLGEPHAVPNEKHIAISQFYTRLPMKLDQLRKTFDHAAPVLGVNEEFKHKLCSHRVWLARRAGKGAINAAPFTAPSTKNSRS